jgi:hypothetical protein
MIYHTSFLLTKKSDSDKISDKYSKYFNLIFRDYTDFPIDNIEVVYGDVVVENCYENFSLGSIKEVRHSITTWNSKIQSLGELVRVRKMLDLKNCGLLTLGKLEIVGENLDLKYNPIESLGTLKSVGTSLNLRDTPIKDLGCLEYVGENLHLPIEVKGKIDLSNVKVGGKVRYWKSKVLKDYEKVKVGGDLTQSEISIPSFQSSYITKSDNLFYQMTIDQQNFYKYFVDSFNEGKYINLENQTSYGFLMLAEWREKKEELIKLELDELLDVIRIKYPFMALYWEEEIIESLFKKKMYSKCYYSYVKTNKVDLFFSLRFSILLNKNLISPGVYYDLVGFGQLTYFGKRNVYKIEKIMREELIVNECEYFNQFFPNLQNNDFEQFGFFDFEHYRNYFPTIHSYNYAVEKSNTEFQFGYRLIYSGDVITIVKEAIKYHFQELFRDAENIFRQRNNMPKIGEGWINETNLLYLIKEYFNDLEIVHHSSPDWLGRQHFDIYIPKYNIAIEYQGKQHTEPIEFFGGKEAFSKNQERDARKKRLCIENNCILIEVYPDYVFEDLTRKILESINIRNSV